VIERNGVVYTDVEQGFELSRRVAALALGELEALTERREDTIGSLLAALTNLEATPASMDSFLPRIVSFLKFMSIARDCRAAAQAILGEAFGTLPPVVCEMLMKAAVGERNLQGRQAMEALDSISRRAMPHCQVFLSVDPTKLLPLILKRDPGLHSRILSYAGSYKHEGSKADLRSPPMVEWVIDAIRACLLERVPTSEFAGEGCSLIETLHGVQVRYPGIDAVHLCRVLKFSAAAAALQDDEHHLKAKCLYALRTMLLDAGAILVKRRLLEDASAVFSLTGGEVIDALSVAARSCRRAV
jgi:hypothetical protein